MKLAQGARLSSETERNVKSGVSRGLNQDQMSQGKDIFIFPDLEVLKFLQFMLEFHRQSRCLIETWSPIEVVHIDEIRVYSSFSLDITMSHFFKGRDLWVTLRKTGHPTQKSEEPELSLRLSNQGY